MNNKNNTIISANGLTKSFGDLTAVDQIDFEVIRGECLGVLGPNGAGKTTTLKMLLGISIPTAGQLQVLNYQLPLQAKELRNHIGVVPQLDNLDPEFSVKENLISYASYFGFSSKTIQKKLPRLIEFAGLSNKADARVTKLSGGMKRRLTLARALVNDPELLILDEPTTGLDPQARQLIWQRLRELKGSGATLILTTHYMEEAERLCDRILVIDNGKILTQGTPRKLIADNIEPQVVEIHGDSREQWLASLQNMANIRVEQIGETVFCYSQDEKPIIDYLEQWPSLEFLHRRANMEDVFLKLTGRELREG